ncbi:MAG TPA: NADH-quinone oxidoreductase subunit NuoN [Pseudomonadales bacterium]|nr:NADH-quinone oxidoreductase subunit NuoN [Pseudomonadales bacterium]
MSTQLAAQLTTQLTLQNLLALLPIIICSGTAVLVMLAIAFKRNHFMNATVTVSGLNAALLAVLWVSISTALPVSVTDLFVVDGFACFYMALILVATLACVTLAHAYMETHSGNREELYLLLTLSATGGLLLVCSRHMAALFIGMEILTVPLFGLIAYSFKRSRSLEAGIKYLVLSAMSTAFMLFGIALLYALTGSLSYSGIHTALAQMPEIPLLAWVGCGMIFVAFAFKLSFVPFHLWTPDVYEGAPAPVSAFLATASKVAVFAALLRLLHGVPLMAFDAMHDVLLAIAGLSIVVGNLLALTQSNVKRMLAYSSVAHFGYLLIAVVSGLNLQQPAVAIYLVTYVVTALASFGVMVQVSSPYQGADADNLQHYRGLFWKRPYLASVMTVAMLSMAGIPMTAGFIGKFYVVMLGVDARLWWLLAALVFGSALGLYYYLRLMVTMFLTEPGMRRFEAPLNWGRTTGGLILLGAALLVILLGVYPEPLLNMAMSIAGV